MKTKRELETNTVIIKDLGIADYQSTWDYQQQWLDNALENRKQQLETQQELLLLEHSHVYTLGKSGDSNNLLINPDFLETIGAQVFNIDRGGDITYHGPGQLVVYPLLDLMQYKMGVKDYVFALEQVVIDLLKEYQISASRVDGKTGIWLDLGTSRERKIAAIGIKCSRHFTMHGLAFNINTDLSYFNHIVPCGIADKQVTSLQQELGKALEMDTIKSRFVALFHHHFKIK